MKKLLAILLALTMLVCCLAACGDKTEDPEQTTGNTEGGEPEAVVDLADYINVANKEYGVDYISLYEQFGADTTIDEVKEDEDGFAYITVDGKDYTLGLDFLTMAMVYNVEVPEGHDVYKTADDVYAGWWKYYIVRWNYLLPEIPLYSNEYYDLYNAKITGVKENPTNPYWGVARALLDWASTKTENNFIIGNSTDLSGKFRYPSFGATSPGAADNDISFLTSGLATVTTNKEGGYCWDNTVVKSHSETENEDGTKTFTIEIHDDLKFSDGTPITAKNYLVTTLVFSTPVAAQAAGKDHQAAMTIVGYDTFADYNGTAAEGTTKELAGLRLLDTYKFSVTIAADYLPYFYDLGYASFSPEFLPLWVGTEVDIKDDGQGAYLTEKFYANTTEQTTNDKGETVTVYDYTMAAHIKASSTNTDTPYPSSGPYVVKNYDTGTKTATLELNTYFKGNYEGTKPSIGTIVYKKIVTNTQMADFKSGGLDFIAGITGRDETNEAITVADASNGAYAYIHYSRAGYGKLGFRADFGATQFLEVRQAIAYCMDRSTFAKDFTGGYGGVVDGPYYTGSWMYQAALKQGMTLDAYATSLDSAIEVLEEGGWIYNADGSAYAGTGVRYKRIPATQIKDSDKTFQSKDGAYKTVLVGDYYYMPLVINWYGTSANPFTDLLVTGFMENANIKGAGMVVQNTIGDFNPMLDELYQAPIYGYYQGTPMYGAFNFATGFNSAVYDYSWNMTIDPSMYDDYSYYYIKDLADFYWLQ